MSDFKKEYKACTLCARSCGVNRTEKVGACGMSDEVYIARASLHAWEEPIISGDNGSGTVFFSGCSLSCVFCQNKEISRGRVGVPVSDEKLAEIMLKLQSDGAHNINFVTPTHFVPSVISAVSLARERGLTLPIVYNTSSYETAKTVGMLDTTVDIYLADYKYNLPKTAKAYSSAENYPEVARTAIAEMVKQKGTPVIKDGLMQSGVIVRILLLPGHLAEAKLSVKYLYETYGDSIYISLMSQYTPMPNMEPPLDRRVSRREYDELVDYALAKGVKNAFIQDGTSAMESFIPPFDLTGCND